MGTPDDEDAASRDLVDLAARIEQLHAWWERGHPEVERRSSLWADNEATKPYQVSHAAWDAISHAIDHLGVMREHTVRGTLPNLTVVTRPYGAYPLLRGAMENASRAIWLLGPKARKERIGRRFRMLLDDERNRAGVSVLIGLGPDTREADTRAELDARCATLGIDLAKYERRLLYGEVVSGAAVFMNGEPDRAKALWRILSALSHGDHWASHSLTEREEVAVSPDGRIVTFRASAPIRNVASFTWMTVGLSEAAIRLFDQRRVDHR